MNNKFLGQIIYIDSLYDTISSTKENTKIYVLYNNKNYILYDLISNLYKSINFQHKK